MCILLLLNGIYVCLLDSSGLIYSSNLMFSYWFSIQMIHPLLKTGHWSPYYYCIVEYYPFQFYYSIVSWTRQWQPTPVLLPGKSHGWRSLVGYSPWGRKESDTTEQLHFHFSLSCTGERNGNPLQYSCLENPMDRGAWQAIVHGVAKSLSDSTHTHT